MKNEIVKTNMRTVLELLAEASNELELALAESETASGAIGVSDYVERQLNDAILLLGASRVAWRRGE